MIVGRATVWGCPIDGYTELRIVANTARSTSLSQYLKSQPNQDLYGKIALSAAINKGKS